MDQTTTPAPENSLESVLPLVGQKATIYVTSSFGFPQTFQCTITDAEVRPYAQYRRALKLHFRKPRQRKDRVMWILPYQDFAIFAGSVELNTDPVKERKQGRHFQVEEWHTCFSPVFLANALASTGQAPVYVQGKGL